MKLAPRNQTLTLNTKELSLYKKRCLTLKQKASTRAITNKTLLQDLYKALPLLPKNFVDLLFIDPPYNLTKKFNANSFAARSLDQYQTWFESWFEQLIPKLKPTASIYICGDWRSSTAIHNVIEKHLIVRNRITWEREKGRGAQKNWKNCSEDIWYCTVSDDFTFNLEDVKLKRKVLAPYTQNGLPKDWQKTEHGNFRNTHPSNLWTDITIPFWSMPENTPHPTQKSEKLLAKIILASSNPGDFILDPFMGSGTTSVVSKKLNRKYLGIEVDPFFAAICEKRLEQVKRDKNIQGYHQGVFWDRNTSLPKSTKKKRILREV